MKYDVYDLLISAEGWYCDGITEDMINDNLDEINKLKEEIGMSFNSEKYNLIILDDCEHTRLDAIAILVDIGVGEIAMQIVEEAEKNGSAVIKQSTYPELRQMQKILEQENFKTVIRTSISE